MEQPPFTLRNITPEEFGSWEGVLGATFGFDPRPDEQEVWKKRAEFDRYLGAFEGEEIVGTGGALTFSMTVPGGAALPFGGVTAIATKPTHRRRGVLTAVMRRLHDDAVARGEVISALWASESVIYGRFGYGVAVEGCDLTIERAHADFADDRPPAGRMRLVGADEAKALIPAVYARATAGIPGTIARRDADWTMYFYDPEHWRDGATTHRYAVYERDGEVAGYALYRQKEEWDQGHARSEVRIGDLQAVDGEAYRALWRYCFSIDLVTIIKANNLRLREPIALLLAAPRRLQQLRTDRIWLRLLDVASALAVRRYAADGEVVLEVRDGFAPEAGGRFLLRGGLDGAECVGTGRSPDVSLSAADLAAAYLGDSRLPELAWLGRVQGDAEAVGRAHRMFQWPVPPWCTVRF
jgi:predicted acetyltransferase